MIGAGRVVKPRDAAAGARKIVETMITARGRMTNRLLTQIYADARLHTVRAFPCCGVRLRTEVTT